MGVFDDTYGIVPHIGDLYSIQVEIYASQYSRQVPVNMEQVVNNILTSEYGCNIKCSLVGAVDKYLMPEIFKFEKIQDAKIEIEKRDYGYIVCIRGYNGYLYAKVRATELTTNTKY